MLENQINNKFYRIQTSYRHVYVYTTVFQANVIFIFFKIPYSLVRKLFEICQLNLFALGQI